MGFELVTNNDAKIANAGLAEHLQNEVAVLSGGFGKSWDAMKASAQSAVDHPGETAMKVAVSTAVGFGLGYLSARTGTLGLVGRGLGVAAGLSFAYQGVKPFYDASVMAWNARSQNDLDQASNLLGQHIGAFTVDFAIQTPGAMAGTFYGSRFRSGLSSAVESKTPAIQTAAETKVVETPVLNGQAKTTILTETGLATTTSPGALVETVVAPKVETVLKVEGASNGGGGGNLVQSAERVSKTTTEVTGQGGKDGSLPVKSLENETQTRANDSSAKANDRTAETENQTRGQGRVHGYRFIQVRPDGRVQPFDVGVGVRENLLVEGKPNIKGTSLTTEAMKMPTADLPKFGSTLAVTDKSIDAMTAISLLAQRIEGRKINNALVDFIAAGGKAEPGAQAFPLEYRAIEAICKTRDLSMGERARFIRGILEGSVSQEQMQLKIDFALKQGQRLVSPVPVETNSAGKLQLVTKLEKEGPAAPIDPPAGGGEGKKIVPFTTKTGTVQVEVGKPVPGQPQRLETSVPTDQVPTDLRLAKYPVRYEYVQLNNQGNFNREFDVGLGIGFKDILQGKRNIDRVGADSIVHVAMKMPAEQLPLPGEKIGILNHDAQRLTAMSILSNRLRRFGIDEELAYYIARNGQGIERVSPNRRGYVDLAFQAIDGIANAANVGLAEKVTFIGRTLDGAMGKGVLEETAAKYAIHRAEGQPFKYVRTTNFKPKDFDFGVEITDASLIKKGQPNLDHHGVGTSVDMPSAAQQALALKDSELPKLGSRVAIQKPDADALTAVAVMANRQTGMPVNSRLVEAIGRRDRGLGPAEGEDYTDIEAQINVIRSFARNDRLLINQRITAIREVLAGTADEQRMVRISERLKKNAETKHEELTDAAKVDILLPGKLSLVTAPHQFWFEARDLGLEKAPVTLVNTPTPNGDGVHFQVISRPNNPATKYMPRAFERFAQMDPPWGGRSEIFVSPHESSMPQEQVIGLLKYYLKPPKYRALWWDARDFVGSKRFYSSLESHPTLFNSISGLGSSRIPSFVFDSTPNWSHVGLSAENDDGTRRASNQ